VERIKGIITQEAAVSFVKTAGSNLTLCEPFAKWSLFSPFPILTDCVSFPLPLFSICKSLLSSFEAHFSRIQDFSFWDADFFPEMMMIPSS